MDQKNVWIKRIIAVVGLIALLFLVLDFNTRMAELTRLTAQFENETRVLQDYSSEKEHLATEIAYASSDGAIEKWAREQGRYSKPGDYPIIPLADPDFEDELFAPTLSESETKSIWELWNQWLFGDVP